MDAEHFLPSVEQSLRDLKLDVIDVLLLHWPPGDDPVEPSLALLQEAHRLGYARHVGVSNYTAAMMRTALSVMDIPIVVNQVEFSPPDQPGKAAGGVGGDGNSPFLLLLHRAWRNLQISASGGDWPAP
jgi:diketogulonate reductase-like aldo/keto reductase